MSALGLNIGVFSNLNGNSALHVPFLLFHSIHSIEEQKTTVWDLTKDSRFVKARVWDYLKILHGFNKSNIPLDDVHYEISSLDHFTEYGDDSIIHDVNFLILENDLEYSENDMMRINALCDKIIIISSIHENPEKIKIPRFFKSNIPVELWYYMNDTTETFENTKQKNDYYFRALGISQTTFIPSIKPVPGFFSLFSLNEVKQNERWSNDITKIYYRA